MLLCVEQTNICSTKSSSLGRCAVMPTPPRFCARYSVDGNALDVPAVRHGDDDVLLVDEVFVLDLAEVDGDLRLALGGILRLDGEQVGLDDVQNAALVGENVL